jgi:nitrate/nitrite transport system substrate-binding protein
LARNLLTTTYNTTAKPYEEKAVSDKSKLYDANTDLSAPCSCGQHHSKHEHDAHAAIDHEVLGREVVESAMVRALFPDDRARRRFLKAVGANTATAAIASVLPVGAMQALAQDSGRRRKRISRSALFRSPAPRP